MQVKLDEKKASRPVLPTTSMSANGIELSSLLPPASADFKLASLAIGGPHEVVLSQRTQAQQAQAGQDLRSPLKAIV